MTEYAAIPRSGSTPFLPVAIGLTATTIKTVLQIAVPSTTDIKIVGWGVSFDGAAGGTQTPVVMSLIDDPTACTGGTSLTPENWGNSQAPASLCVGGAALTGYNFTEVTPTGPRYLDSQAESPQAGYGVWFPTAHQPRVGSSRFLRIRCTAPATVNAYPWLVWVEPAV